jgi:hypothetical protein
VTTSKFKEIALKVGVLPPDLPIAMEMMQNLGNLIYFKDSPELRDTIILNSQWLSRIFATLITTKHSFGKRDGFMLKRDITHLWKDYGNHSLLESLLMNFELIHYIPEPITTQKGKQHVFSYLQLVDSAKQHRILIPSFLPADRPSNVKDFDGLPYDTLFIRFCKLSFIPYNFMSRLIVRCLHFVESHKAVWWDGICFEKNGQHGLVEMTSEDCIQVTIKGKNRSLSAKLLR